MQDHEMIGDLYHHRGSNIMSCKRKAVWKV